MVLLDVKNVRKVYTTRFGGNQVEALKDVNFSVEQGEYVAIMGESGSGKSTLLNILAALDKTTEGKVFLKEKDLSKVKEKEMAAFRRNNLGFVFQDFNLLDTFSLKDNIFLPLVLSGTSYREMERRLLPLADKLGIKNLLAKYPYEVSFQEDKSKELPLQEQLSHSRNFCWRMNRPEHWILRQQKNCCVYLHI